MKYISIAFLIFCFSFSSYAQQDTVFYSVVTKGKINGGSKRWKQGANEYHSTYQFNDRGRGDSTVTTFFTTADGRISSLEASGVDYFKNPYHESFSSVGDSLVWTINSDKKSRKNTNQFYLSDQELLIRWLMKQPDKRAAVVPDGFVRMDPSAQKTLAIQNGAIHLQLLAFYNEPSPMPAYVWMTDDLSLFASVSNWSSIIRKGYEGMIDSLLTLQETASEGYYTSELKNNSKQLPARTLLTHADIFESETASVQKDRTVEIVNGKIADIYPSSAVHTTSKADTVIDCKGKFLMPGLWDMHGHYSKESGSFYLAGGVTHIRDMGNDKTLLMYRKQITENKLLGPDISYVSGFIDKEDPFQGPTGNIIRSLEEGIKTIDDYHQAGYPQIKLYSAIKPAWVKPMAEHAHSLGMRVCGHIPAFMTAEQAIDAGYDEITHMNFIFLNFMGDTIDTRTPARFRLVGANAGKLDLKSGRVKDFLDLMRRKHIALDPTMNVWQGMFDEFKGDTSHFVKPVISWLPEDWLSNLTIQSPFGSDEQKPVYSSAFANMMKMLKLLYDNNILLVAGTDGGYANALHHELEIYVQAGIPANQVLKIATYNAAADCNLQKRYGAIKTGMQADLILIDGNPVSNISDIRRVELVVKNNNMYQPRQLLSSQGWKYYH